MKQSTKNFIRKSYAKLNPWSIRDVIVSSIFSFSLLKVFFVNCFNIIVCKYDCTALQSIWMGVRSHKYPTDLWMYQEIIYEIKPDVIIESGTELGGTTLFLANICDLLNHGRVISIDVVDCERPKHHRIEYLFGSSVSNEIIDKVKDSINDVDVVLVILDSDHSTEHVLSEMRKYSNFVSSGSYLIVEDTNLGGHPVMSAFRHGPMDAVNKFIKENDSFIIDRSRENFLMTLNPRGYLRKK